jgi:hypothetical protein
MALKMRKITVHVPAGLLEAAMRATNGGLTATVIEGLRELDRRSKRSTLRALRGKVHFDLELRPTRR